MKPGVMQKYESYPDPVRPLLLAVRSLVIDVESADNLGELEETLKWGEPAYLVKGARLMSAIRRAKIPVYKQATALEACGSGLLEVLKFSSRGRDCERDTATLRLHMGGIPQY